MALVQNAVCDFVLFPRESAMPDMANSDALTYSYQHLEPQGTPEFDLTATSYNSYSAAPAYATMSAAYYHPQLMSKSSSMLQTPQRYPASISPAVSLELSSSHQSHASGASGPSTASSVMGSPYSFAPKTLPSHDQWTDSSHDLTFTSGVLSMEHRDHESYTTPASEDLGMDSMKFPGSFVNPALIHSYDHVSHGATSAPFSSLPNPFHAQSHAFPSPSPAPSEIDHHDHQARTNQFYSAAVSPFSQPIHYHQYAHIPPMRRLSIGSNRSHLSHESPRSISVGFDEEGKERGRCPRPECGRPIKDIKAHMLTHMSERPEKCPIATCSYHTKGFARKYDKNRHTLTHYKGTMICGFCPGSGSPAEKSFNRADVFKRHLTTVHHVEQSPPNGRKKSPSSSSKKLSSYAPDATGRCSTCLATFGNAQDFYEHLDDCVLRSLEQADPSEAINERHLTHVADDKDVKDTLDRHLLSSDFVHDQATLDNEDNEDNSNDEDDDVEYDSHDDNDSVLPMSSDPRSGKGSLPSHRHGSSRPTHASASRITKPSFSSTDPKGRSVGLTASKGGVAPTLTLKGGRRRREHYPNAWGCPADQLKMRKRVLCVFDGTRRLWKDEMMLDNDFEVRVPLDGENGGPNASGAYVTDLDVATLARANALHGATEEERGPWFGDAEVEKLMV